MSRKSRRRLRYGIHSAIAVGAVSVVVSISMLATGGAGSATILGINLGPAATTTNAASVNKPITAQTSTVPQTTTSDGATDCGGLQPTGVTGTWTCTFDDEFDGTTLNTNNWNVVATATSGYHSGSECYINSPSTVNVSGGTLNLTLNKVAPFTCKSLTGNYSTSYTAGAVNTDANFSQTYGYFEVKAKLPKATIKGLQTSLWLWPVNDTKYGSQWPASGEIDIAEWYSEYPSLAIPYVHYNIKGGKSADPNVTNNYCTVTNTNGYNTYAVVWTPQTITMLIDGQTCVTDNWNPAAPEVKPDPFNMPFFINLTAAMGIVTNSPAYNIATDLPATSNIDYVRVWSQNS